MDYKIVYSKRKTLSICIKDGAVIVRSPFGVSSERISTFVKSHGEWINHSLEKQQKRRAKFENLTEEDISALKREAKIYFVRETERISKIMGLKYGRITITSAKTRFGSCSSKGNISYSYRLMLYPEAARQYVIVHELSHLVYMDHSKKFYQLIEKYMPNYKEIRKLLKE